MNRDKKRELISLAKSIKELQRKVEALERDVSDNEYDKSMGTSVTCAMPLWVRDLFIDRLKPIIDNQLGDIPHRRGVQQYDVSVGSTLRFILYYAIMNPEAFEYVSLDELWELKKVRDEYDERDNDIRVVVEE